MEADKASASGTAPSGGVLRPGHRPESAGSRAFEVARLRSAAKFVEYMIRQIQDQPDALPLKSLLGDIERMIIIRVLAEVHGNQRHAARILGLKPTTLFEKARRHRIKTAAPSMPEAGPTFYSEEVEARYRKTKKIPGSKRAAPPPKALRISQEAQ